MKRSRFMPLFGGAALLLLVGFSACGNSQNAKDGEATYESPELPDYNFNDTTRMSPIRETDSIRVKGHTYTYTIERTPLDSVVIVDEDGFKGYDNSILLTVRRDGADFFQKRLSKAAFHINIDETFYRQCVLLGMNFNKTTEYGLQFLTSLGKVSDSEDRKPYALTVGYDGSLDITEHELYDNEDVQRFEDEGV